jgi:ligand-binding SRPBCC domain-containing protein
MLRLERKLVVPSRLKEVFPFFADPSNLEHLTPRFLRFQIVTPVPLEMCAGAIIDYRLRIRGILIKWQSEITAWEPPLRFVDEQRRGPYRTWIHEHLFRECGAETEIVDNVQYEVLGGRLVNRLFVQRELEKIFDFRHKALLSRFAGEESSIDLLNSNGN